MNRGGTLSSISSSSFSSRRVRVLTELPSGEVTFATSLEPTSMADSFTFLLAPLSDAFLHNRMERHSAWH